MKFFENKFTSKLTVALGLGFFLNVPVWALGGSFNPIIFDHKDQKNYIHKVINQDQFKGNWKQLKGALKENWGEFTDDDLLAIEGRAERFEGKLQERYGERKEEVREWVDKWLEEHPYEDHAEMR